MDNKGLMSEMIDNNKLEILQNMKFLMMCVMYVG